MVSIERWAEEQIGDEPKPTLEEISESLKGYPSLVKAAEIERRFPSNYLWELHLKQLWRNYNNNIPKLKEEVEEIWLRSSNEPLLKLYELYSGKISSGNLQEQIHETIKECKEKYE